VAVSITARCYASAVYAVMQCPSVRLSVRLSRSWITSKRINISLNFFHHRVVTQTALARPENLFHYRNTVENFAQTKFYWNLAIDCRVIMATKWWRPSAIFNIKNFHIWSRDYHEVPNLHCVLNFIKIGCCLLIYSNFTIWPPSAMVLSHIDCKSANLLIFICEILTTFQHKIALQ